MRLKITQASSEIHTDLVAAAGWALTNELYTCSDDLSICKWQMTGEAGGKVCDLETYSTDLQWCPVRTKQAGSDVFAVACTDGSFKLFAKTGRLEKSVEAHQGACISLRWNHEGTALATAGEDGVVKVWSRVGALRSTLVQSEVSVYSLAWGPDSDQVLYTSGKHLIIKPLQPSAKVLSWKAGEGIVLKVDWNPISNLIASCGEDCRYKVWDCFGRLLFQSEPLEYAVTSVAWSPDGELFAAGSFNALQLCDKTGWTHAKQTTDTGSILNIAWTSDGTQLAGAGGSGAVCFAQVIDRTIEWQKLAATLEEVNRIRVHDVLNETYEDLEFKDRIIKMSLGFGHLVVATATQCSIYNVNNWNTPHIFDLKDTVNLIMQCKKQFLVVDNFNGITIYTYEGRQVSNPKFQGLRTEFLNHESVSIANDTLAVIDRSDRGEDKKDKKAGVACAVRVFDSATGKQLGEPITHNLEITDLALSHAGSERKLVFIDRNRDLYITPVLKPHVVKMGTMCDSVVWHESTDMLAAMVDQKLVVWYYPGAIFVDKDLVHLTKFVKETNEFGSVPKISYFQGSRATIRKSNGTLLTASVSQYPQLLYEYVGALQWDKAIRLCRHVRDSCLWACLAAMAVHHKDLNTAELSFAAIDDMDKLQYIQHIKQIPSEEGRAAELALFRRRPEEAEAILLQAGLTYRAIKSSIRQFNWDRALELAVNYRTHVDTVLWKRRSYLASVGRQETNPRFLQYAQSVEIDPDAIKAKIQQEKEKEMSRPVTPFLRV